MHSFSKTPKKSFDIEKTDINQLDFPINLMMSLDEQFELANSFKDKEKFRHMKYRFHAMLGKNEDAVWSPV